ncbi:MAG TPA: endonuclease V, partial [Gaiellales bacterium]|nr:endonuclease V [Gaiellales bacterium]
MRTRRSSARRGSTSASPGKSRAWPAGERELVALQTAIAALTPPVWEPPAAPLVGGCFVCFPRGGHGPGAAGDPAMAAAAVLRGGRVVASHIAHGEAGAAYAPGFLALREGPLLAAPVDELDARPDVLLVDATGR